MDTMISAHIVGVNLFRQFVIGKQARAILSLPSTLSSTMPFGLTIGTERATALQVCSIPLI
jgi:hypothetical protein